MADDTPERVLRNGGRLVVDPTNLAAAYPYGGTPLGILGSYLLRWQFVTDKARGADDRHAQELVEELYVGESLAFAFTLRQWDNDPLNVFFPNRIAGATRTVLTDQYAGVAGSRRPGTRLTSNNRKLLFVPNNPDMPSLIFYSACPSLAGTHELRFSAMDELVIGAALEAMYHPSIGKVHKIGLLSEITLT